MNTSSSWFLDSWLSVVRVVSVGAVTYLAVIVALRIFGNRTLAKTASFDHVVTVALGSVLATALLSKETTFGQGAAALLLLMGLQYAIALAVSRMPALRAVVVSKPQVLVYRGRRCDQTMAGARVTLSDLHAVLRKQGMRCLEAADLVVLESDGTFSVIGKSDSEELSVTEGIRDQLI